MLCCSSPTRFFGTLALARLTNPLQTNHEDVRTTPERSPWNKLMNRMSNTSNPADVRSTGGISHIPPTLPMLLDSALLVFCPASSRGNVQYTQYERRWNVAGQVVLLRPEESRGTRKTCTEPQRHLIANITCRCVVVVVEASFSIPSMVSQQCVPHRVLSRIKQSGAQYYISSTLKLPFISLASSPLGS
mmetsp:Transcript_12962/g.35782  ORF Transcript_12962/g.35782 Transcript_12962/m.35782 type:complete len:189 (-) Transcript_12962:839-1405(-)